MEDTEILQAKIQALEEEVKLLRDTIHRGISEDCQYFCALSECPKACLDVEKF